MTKVDLLSSIKKLTNDFYTARDELRREREEFRNLADARAYDHFAKRLRACRLLLQAIRASAGKGRALGRKDGAQ